MIRTWGGPSSKNPSSRPPPPPSLLAGIGSLKGPFALSASAFAALTPRYDQLHDMFSKYGCIYEIGIKYNEGLFGASSIAYSTIK